MKRSLIIMTLLSATLMMTACGKSKGRSRSAVTARQTTEATPAGAPDANEVTGRNDHNQQSTLLGGSDSRDNDQTQDTQLLGAPEGGEVDGEQEQEVVQDDEIRVSLGQTRQVRAPVCPPVVIQQQRQERIQRQERVIEPQLMGAAAQQRQQQQEIQVQQIERIEPVQVLHPESDVRQTQTGVLLQQVMPQEIAAGSLVRKLFGNTLFSDRLQNALDMVINSSRAELAEGQRLFRNMIYGDRQLNVREESEFATTHLNRFSFAPVERMNFQMPAGLRANTVEVQANFQMEMRRGTQAAYAVQSQEYPGQILGVGLLQNSPFATTFTRSYGTRSQFFTENTALGRRERSSTQIFCFETLCADQGIIRTDIALSMVPSMANEQGTEGSFRNINSYEMAWANKTLNATTAWTRRRDGRSAATLSADENALIAMLRLSGTTQHQTFQGQTVQYDVRRSGARVRVEGWMDESKRDVAMMMRLLPASGRQSLVAIAQSNLAPNTTQAILENARFEQIGNIFQGTALSNGGILEGSMLYLGSDQKVGLKLITQNLEIIVNFAD